MHRIGQGSLHYLLQQSVCPSRTSYRKTLTEVQRKIEKTTIRNPFVTVDGSLPCPDGGCRDQCGVAANKTENMVDVSYRTSIGQLPTITVLSFSRPFVGVFSVSTRIQRTYYKTVIYKKGNAIYRTVTKLVDVSTLNEEGTGKRRHTDRRLANCGALVSVIL